MRVKLKQTDLSQNNLGWLCIEPMILMVRGKSLIAKSDLYEQLNEGQRALYMFYAFHNHTKTIPEFYWFTAYFMSELQAWNGLKKGVKFFNDQEMFIILNELGTLIESMHKRADGTWQEPSPSDIETNKEQYGPIEKLYLSYHSIVLKTIDQINSYIRNNQSDFLEIE